MTTALAKTADLGAQIEQVLIGGDLSRLSVESRLTYYRAVCESVGLNPLTKPFEYITLNGKLTLYARKDCTDQLRSKHGVSIGTPDIKFEDDWIIVAVAAKLPDGRTDSDIGVVSRKDMRGDFGNALMKALTKAKRRVTLSICGLGMLDETEVESIPDARPEPQALPAAADEPTSRNGHDGRADAMAELGRVVRAAKQAGMTNDDYAEMLSQFQASRTDELNEGQLRELTDMIRRLGQGGRTPAMSEGR